VPYTLLGAQLPAGTVPGPFCEGTHVMSDANGAQANVTVKIEIGGLLRATPA
jgi:hypothetical protein